MNFSHPPVRLVPQLPGPWLLRLAVVLAAASPAGAYTVSPSLLPLRPAGDGTSGFVQIANRAPKPIAVELTMHAHHRDELGRSVRGSAEEIGDDFLIYPAQLVLLPGDEASVQVRWIGPPNLPVERAYTLVTRQVPIPSLRNPAPEPAEGVHVDVTVLMNYEVRVYVTPPGARPKVVVESVVENPSDADGETFLEILLLNQGNARATLNDTPLRLSPERAAPGQRPVVLPAGSVPALKTPILPGDRRRLRVPRPAGLPPGPVRASLSG